MANSPSAKKRAKQAEKRNSHNASLRSMVRTHIKNVVKALDAKDLAKAQEAYAKAVPVIDRMADKGIIDKNKAAAQSCQPVSGCSAFSAADINHSEYRYGRASIHQRSVDSPPVHLAVSAPVPARAARP